MTSLTDKETKLIEHIRKLQDYQKIEIKLSKDGKIVYTITTNQRYTIYE